MFSSGSISIPVYEKYAQEYQEYNANDTANGDNYYYI